MLFISYDYFVRWHQNGFITLWLLTISKFLFQIISDIDLKAPSVKLVQLLSLHPNVTVYMYEFDYSSKDDVIVTKYGSSKNLWVGKSQKKLVLTFFIGIKYLYKTKGKRVCLSTVVFGLLELDWATDRGS